MRLLLARGDQDRGSGCPQPRPASPRVKQFSIESHVPHTQDVLVVKFCFRAPTPSAQESFPLGALSGIIIDLRQGLVPFNICSNHRHMTPPLILWSTVRAIASPYWTPIQIRKRCPCSGWTLPSTKMWQQECLSKVLLKIHGIIKRKWHHSIISLSWAWGSLKGCLLTLLGTFLLSRKSLYLCDPSSWETDCPVLLAGSSLSSLTFLESHTCISNTVIYFQPSVLYWSLATILMIPKISGKFGQFYHLLSWSFYSYFCFWAT